MMSENKKITNIKHLMNIEKGEALEAYADAMTNSTDGKKIDVVGIIKKISPYIIGAGSVIIILASNIPRNLADGKQIIKDRIETESSIPSVLDGVKNIDEIVYKAMTVGKEEGFSSTEVGIYLSKFNLSSRAINDTMESLSANGYEIDVSRITPLKMNLAEYKAYLDGSEKTNEHSRGGK